MSLRFHQSPSRRLVARSVNQYCQTTARTARGGRPSKGLPAKSLSTLELFSSRRTSVNTTHSYWRQLPSDANHKYEWVVRSEEHTSELQSLAYLVCRLLL